MADLKAARARDRKGGRPKMNQQKLHQDIAMYHSQSITVKLNPSGYGGFGCYNIS